LANGSAAPTSEAALVACLALLGDHESDCRSREVVSSRQSPPSSQRRGGDHIRHSKKLGTAAILAFALHLIG
jgi:hypothetical protein